MAHRFRPHTIDYFTLTSVCVCVEVFLQRPRSVLGSFILGNVPRDERKHRPLRTLQRLLES